MKTENGRANSVTKTYRVRLLPRKRTHCKLEHTLDLCRDLYNAANEERRSIHRRFLEDEWVAKAKLETCGLKPAARREPAPTKFGQHKALTEIRRDDPDGVGAVTVSALRGALNALADAWKDVGKTRPSGATVRPPRFKARSRDHVVNYADPSAVHVRDRYIVCRDFGAVRLRIHRELPEGEPIAVRIVRDETTGDTRDGHGGTWSAHLTYRVPVDARRRRGRCTGIDLGSNDYVITCDGVALKAHQAGRKDEPAARWRQRAVARCTKGSHGRRKRRVRHRKSLARVTSRRQDEARRAAARIMQRNDGIAVERPADLHGPLPHTAREIAARRRMGHLPEDAGVVLREDQRATRRGPGERNVEGLPVVPSARRSRQHAVGQNPRLPALRTGRTEGHRLGVRDPPARLRRAGGAGRGRPVALQRRYRSRRRAGNTRPSTDGRGSPPPRGGCRIQLFEHAQLGQFDTAPDLRRRERRPKAGLQPDIQCHNTQPRASWTPPPDRAAVQGATSTGARGAAPAGAGTSC